MCMIRQTATDTRMLTRPYRRALLCVDGTLWCMHVWQESVSCVAGRRF
jgi:hypothetical protein